MAKKKGGAGRVAKAAGAAAAGVSVEAALPREFNQGDLVLAKVKGWPAWPAQVEKLETQGKHQGKYYVTYFGPGQQIGWCLLAELSDFDAEQKEAALQKSQKKTADKKFISAVKEICAVQDERAGIAHKDSRDEDEEIENVKLAEDDAPRYSEFDGQEDDMTKEGDPTSDVKHDTHLTQVTLNQQEDSISFNDRNPGDVEDDAADKDWSEKPEYNGSGVQTGRDSDERKARLDGSPSGAGGEAAKPCGDVEDEDLEANGETRHDLSNALKRINEKVEKGPEPKREVAEGEVPVLTYQYWRKKNRNKNNNLDRSLIVNGGTAIAGQAIVEESAALVAENSEVQKKMKPKVGRPSKASQQAKMGCWGGKANVQVTRKPNAGEKHSKLERGNGGNSHEGSRKFVKDSANNGHSTEGPYVKRKKKKNMHSLSVIENRERMSEEKKDVKKVVLEADTVKKGRKESLLSSLEEGPNSKSDVRGDGSLKRRRLVGEEGEGEEGDISMEGERGDAGPSPRTDTDEKHLPLSKKPKMLASVEKSSEGKQKHASVGRPALEGCSNAERDSPREGKSRDRGTSLPPKTAKDGIRKAPLDEATLPPSKRQNRAFAAVSACEAEAITASAAEPRKQAVNGAFGNQGCSNEAARNEGAEEGAEEGGLGSLLKNATVTPDISDSGDRRRKVMKAESEHENDGGQERIEGKKYVALRDAHATDSPSKDNGSVETSRLLANELEDRAKSFEPKSAVASQNSDGHGCPGATKASSEGVTEKRKGHLLGSESGQLSSSTPGETETFASDSKPSFDDLIIKNAMVLANEKRTMLKREADSSASMNVLITAGQAKQRARQYSTGGSESLGFAEFDKFTTSMVCSPSPSRRRGTSGLTSPIQHDQAIGSDAHDRHGGVDERAGAGLMEAAIDTEATIARDTFVGMLETVSQTKDSIGRTTRQAMDCAKHGLAEQIVEIIVLKLENEPSFHRRVDFWFLLDSVTQESVCWDASVAAYLPIVQASLPRILNAAAPPGSAARENRKQCLKVLNLWLERKVMPESVLRHFMTEIESQNDDKGLAGGGHRRLSRCERGVDDPVTDMDGMLVDEYGSNAPLNLRDGCSIIPQLLEDEEEGSGRRVDTDSLGAIHVRHLAEDEEAVQKHRIVAKDVDEELEMEDVSPTFLRLSPLFANIMFL